MTDTMGLWIGFNVFILAMLALNLGLFHRKSHVVSLGVIVAILTTSVVWSLLRPKKQAIPALGRVGNPRPAATARTE